MSSDPELPDWPDFNPEVLVSDWQNRAYIVIFVLLTLIMAALTYIAINVRKKLELLPGGGLVYSCRESNVDTSLNYSHQQMWESDHLISNSDFHSDHDLRLNSK